MKENKTYFLLTILTMGLSAFLLFKIYNNKNDYKNLRNEYDSYKSEQENKQEWSNAKYWDLNFKYPKDWHLAIFFTDDSHATKTYAINPYPIDMTFHGYSKGIYELTIYDDTSTFNDEFWQKTQEEYLKNLEFVEPETITTQYGTINYIKAKEGLETAPGQNVEAYFYKFTYPEIIDGKESKRTVYLKLELLYINDFRLTKMMREIILSFKPAS